MASFYILLHPSTSFYILNSYVTRLSRLVKTSTSLILMLQDFDFDIPKGSQRTCRVSGPWSGPEAWKMLQMMRSWTGRTHPNCWGRQELGRRWNRWNQRCRPQRVPVTDCYWRPQRDGMSWVDHDRTLRPHRKS